MSGYVCLVSKQSRIHFVNINYQCIVGVGQALKTLSPSVIACVVTHLRVWNIKSIE